MPPTRFAKMRGVIDASCLIRLLYLNDLFLGASQPHLNILRALALGYSVIYIPEYVWEEVARHGRSKRRFRQFVQEHYIFEKCKVGDKDRARLLYDRLRNPHASIERGEAEAIIQASECRVTEILTDDIEAAKFAHRHSLTTRDTPDLIVMLKRNGIIEEVRPLIESLHKHRKFRLKQRRLAEILKETGE